MPPWWGISAPPQQPPLASSAPAHGCCTGCWPGCAWRFPFRWHSIWAQTVSRTPGAFCGSPCCSIWRWVLPQRPLAWASAGFCPGGWAQTRHCRQTLRRILPSGRLPCLLSWLWAPTPPCCALRVMRLPRVSSASSPAYWTSSSTFSSSTPRGRLRYSARTSRSGVWAGAYRAQHWAQPLPTPWAVRWRWAFCC